VLQVKNVVYKGEVEIKLEALCSKNIIIRGEIKSLWRTKSQTKKNY
jgi:hypothetical protein